MDQKLFVYKFFLISNKIEYTLYTIEAAEQSFSLIPFTKYKWATNQIYKTHC